ncbi:MAG TPA: hypothetical protein VLF60_04260 [Candidatus Saccharimonadales bacterium]|nr:hypothetical protein [Candidatus Saccharimonadales bacterium]
MEKLLELQTSPVTAPAPTRLRRKRALATGALLFGGVGTLAGCGGGAVHGQQVAAPISASATPHKTENGAPKISMAEFKKRCATTEHVKLADGTRGPAAFIVGNSVVVSCYKYDLQPQKAGMDIGVFTAGTVTVKAYPNWRADGTSQHEKCDDTTLVDDFELADSSQVQKYPHSPICTDGKVSMKEYLEQLGVGTYAAVQANS